MAMKEKGGKGANMDNAKGLCSYPSNPLPMPKMVESMCGPGSNPDQAKANKLLKKAYAEKEYLRGKSGM